MFAILPSVGLEKLSSEDGRVRHLPSHFEVQGKYSLLSKGTYNPSISRP